MQQTALIKIIAIIGLIIVISCTENPFTEPEKIQDMKITGRVELNDGNSPDQVYVWLELLDLGTFTNHKGKFSLALPPSDLQVEGAGVTGNTRLYFYLSDYKMIYKTIEFAEGELTPDQEAIAADGQLQDTIRLEKIFNIIFYPQQDSAALKDSSMLSLQVEMSTPCNTLHTIQFERVGRNPVFYGLIFEPQGNTAQDPVFYDSRQAVPVIISLEKFKNFSVQYDYSPISLGLTPGIYAVYPYAEIVQTDTIPDQILNNIGQHIIAYGHHYCLLPNKIDKQSLIITE